MIIPIVIWWIRRNVYGIYIGDSEPFAYIAPIAFIVSGVLNLLFLGCSIFGQEKNSVARVVSVVTLLLQLGLLYQVISNYN